MAKTENSLFLTDEQYVGILKDKAIFDESYHMRKKAVFELVRMCSNRESAMALVSELIDSCPVDGDQQFKDFCMGLLRSSGYSRN